MAREVILPSGRKVYVTHTMADGSVRDSVAGYDVPYNETTAIAYNILANIAMRVMKEQKEKEKSSS